MSALHTFVVIFSVFLFAPLVNNYRILGLIPYNGRSHFIMFEPLFKALAERGHEVDVLSHFPQKEKIPRYNDYSLLGTFPMLLGNVKYDSMVKSNFLSFFNMLLEDYGWRICDRVFNTTTAKNLRDTNNTYDLIITEIFFFDCMYGFSHHFKAPVIAISTNVDLPWGAKRIGNPINPSYIPNYFLPYLSKMDLLQRVWNTLYYVVTSVYYELYGLEYGTQLTRKFFKDENMPHLRELISNNTSFMFINTHFSINYVAPKVPNLVEIAGIHIHPPKPLPSHLEKVLNIGDDYKGVIYLSFGSLIAVESLPINILQAFFDSFKELPYKILFKGPKEKIVSRVNVSDNVHFEKWLPQRDVLCHPNVKLFISHGGLMGTQEGIYCGVPSLGLPIFADQELNIANSQARGIALKLNFKDVNKESFLNTVKTLLEDKSFKQNAERISELFRDRPQSALDTAVYWTEYVLKHNGAFHLRCLAADMPLYEYYLVDVICFIILVPLTCLGICFYLFQKIKKIVTGDNKKMSVINKNKIKTQ